MTSLLSAQKAQQGKSTSQDEHDQDELVHPEASQNDKTEDPEEKTSSLFPTEETDNNAVPVT